MSPATTSQVALATYQLTDGTHRTLHVTTTGDTYLLTDAPAHGTDGREYVIERQVPDLTELRAIALDYLAQTERAHVPPADIRRLYPDHDQVIA